MQTVLCTTFDHKPASQAFHEQLPNSFEGFDILKVPPKFWPHIYILDHTKDLRFQIRLSGTAIEDGLNRSLKGRFMDEISHGPNSKQVLAGFKSCLNNIQPLYMRQQICAPNRPSLIIQASAQPLPLHPGHQPNRIIGLMFVDYPTACTDSVTDFCAQPLFY